MIYASTHNCWQQSVVAVAVTAAAVAAAEWAKPFFFRWQHNIQKKSHRQLHYDLFFFLSLFLSSIRLHGQQPRVATVVMRIESEFMPSSHCPRTIQHDKKTYRCHFDSFHTTEWNQPFFISTKKKLKNKFTRI